VKKMLVGRKLTFDQLKSVNKMAIGLTSSLQIICMLSADQLQNRIKMNMHNF
jgi:hypothetical protein